jgi:hypothetical protein
MYECQTRSKRDRALVKVLNETFAPDKFMEGREKYFKPFYRGKPTKTFLKLLELERAAARAMKTGMKDFL